MKTQLTIAPTTPGEPFAGGFYGGRIRIGETVFAVAWAPKAEGQTTGAWHADRAAVPAATSVCDSMANTVAMAEAGSAIANWARGLAIGGFTDWCLPARDVLELGYRLLKPTKEQNYCTWRDGDNPSSMPPGVLYTGADPAQTVATAFQEGGPEAFDARIYWSSTQFSPGGAYDQTFYYGYQNLNNKKYEAAARAVRLIQLTP